LEFLRRVTLASAPTTKPGVPEPRGWGLLCGVTVAVVSLILAGQPAYAQAQQPLPAGTDLTDLLANPGDWASAMFNAALIGLGQRTTSDVVGFMGWLLGNGNVISQTPPGLSYNSEIVGRLWGSLRVVANAGLAVVTVWGGLNRMINPHIRAPYHGALELIPRVLLSGILINTSLDWGHFVIDLNNALCQQLGTTSIPAWSSVQQLASGSPLLNLIAIAIYLVMGLLLLGQMLMRLALLDTLLIVAPLALLCWVLPQTTDWARMWFSTFFATVFVQSIQVLVLQVGADLIQQLPALLPSSGAGAAEDSRVWLMTLLFGVAVLQLARTVPRLMPGYPGGRMGGSPSVGGLRQVASLIRLGTGRGGIR
jgi:hypothetical protein